MPHALRFPLLALLALQVHCGPGTTPDAGADAPATDAARDGVGLDATTDDAGAGFDAVDAPPSDQPAADVAPDVADAVADAGGGARRVFVSSALYNGGFADGSRDDAGVAQGLAVGDSLCQGLAASAGLGGRWVAWLSTRDADAIDHVLGAGPWVTMSGSVAFPDRAGLAGAPLVPVDRDETGAAVDPSAAVVWTGTATGGRRIPSDATSDTHHCYGWGYAGTDRLTGGGVGSAALAATWTRTSTIPCNRMARLYCFEQ